MAFAASDGERRGVLLRKTWLKHRRSRGGVIGAYVRRALRPWCVDLRQKGVGQELPLGQGSSTATATPGQEISQVNLFSSRR